MAIRPRPQSSQRRRANRAWVTVVLASLGGAFEIYDFIIYGVFAREIGFHFFPGHDPIVSMMSTFSVFALGYLVRPVGGMILGSLGDRYGRRFIFLFSILAMSGVARHLIARMRLFCPILSLNVRIRYPRDSHIRCNWTGFGVP